VRGPSQQASLDSMFGMFACGIQEK
jgi:hypothetical protein